MVASGLRMVAVSSPSHVEVTCSMSGTRKLKALREPFSLDFWEIETAEFTSHSERRRGTTRHTAAELLSYVSDAERGGRNHRAAPT